MVHSEMCGPKPLAVYEQRCGRLLDHHWIHRRLDVTLVDAIDIGGQKLHAMGIVPHEVCRHLVLCNGLGDCGRSASGLIDLASKDCQCIDGDGGHEASGSEE